MAYHADVDPYIEPHPQVCSMLHACSVILIHHIYVVYMP